MTLQDVAEASGFSRSELSKLETGQRPLRADHLIKLAPAFGVSPNDLVAPELAAQFLGQLAETPRSGTAAINSGQDRLGIFGEVRENKLHDLHVSNGDVTVTLPHGLSRKAFVVYNPTSNFGGIRAGDLLVVTTMIPPVRGDLCLIRYADESGEVCVFETPPPPPALALKIAAVLFK